MDACRAWSIWEGTTSKLFPDPDFIATFAGDKFALSFARIENHVRYGACTREAHNA